MILLSSYRCSHPTVILLPAREKDRKGLRNYTIHPIAILPAQGSNCKQKQTLLVIIYIDILFVFMVGRNYIMINRCEC